MLDLFSHIDDPELKQYAIVFSFYMNVANCPDYDEKTRDQAKNIALNVGKKFGLRPMVPTREDVVSYNEDELPVNKIL